MGLGIHLSTHLHVFCPSTLLFEIWLNFVVHILVLSFVHQLLEQIKLLPYGIYNVIIICYSGFFPVAVNFLRRVPVVGTILNLPGIRSVSLIRIVLILYKSKTTNSHQTRYPHVVIALQEVYKLYSSWYVNFCTLLNKKNAFFYEYWWKHSAVKNNMVKPL